MSDDHTRFRAGAATDVGRVRSNNQDAKLLSDDLYAVADGMGGHLGGEVAAAMAVETFRAAIDDATVEGVVAAARQANHAIFERSAADPDLRGMGTTLCALALVEADGRERLMILNVGDSRAYRLRNGELSQLTRDHSLVEDLRAEGRLTAEEAAVHPHRNILTRALGIDPDVEVDHLLFDAVTDDRYVLCSDGLFNEVTPERMAAALRGLADPTEAARELVRLANDHGGRDNITVVVVDVAAASGVAARNDDTAIRPAVGSSSLTPEDDVAGFTTAAPPEPKPAAPTPAPPAEPRAPRRITWRVVLFVLVVLAVLAAAVGAVGWYTRRTYYVGVQDGQILIYQGRPGGVLWFDPTVAERTGISLTEMPAQNRDDLQKGVDEPSLAAAHRYLDRLRVIAAAQGVAQTTTTTTAPATTTTAPAAAHDQLTPSTTG